LPIRIHDLLLSLAGRLDDDALADARQMLASAELDRSLEFVAGCLAAGDVVLTAEQHRELETLFADTYLDSSVVDRVAVRDSAPAGRHRFAVGAVDGRDPEQGVSDALRPVLDVLPDVRSVWCVWRLTPAGPVSGPVPHRLVLVGVGPGGFAPATAYRVEYALRRSGIRASVEVLVDGNQPTEYHQEAMRCARQVPFAEPDMADRPRVTPVEPVRAGSFDAPRPVAQAQSTSGEPWFDGAEPSRAGSPAVPRHEAFPPRAESPVAAVDIEPPAEPSRIEPPRAEPSPEPPTAASRAEPMPPEPDESSGPLPPPIGMRRPVELPPHGSAERTLRHHPVEPPRADAGPEQRRPVDLPRAEPGPQATGPRRMLPPPVELPPPGEETGPRPVDLPRSESGQDGPRRLLPPPIELHSEGRGDRVVPPPETNGERTLPPPIELRPADAARANGRQPNPAETTSEFAQERPPEDRPADLPTSALSIQTPTNSTPSPPRRRARPDDDPQRPVPDNQDTHSAALGHDVLNTQERNLLRELQDELARREQHDQGPSGGWSGRHGKPFDQAHAAGGPMMVNGVPPRTEGRGYPPAN
jgi:hypothetical protein